MNNLEDNDTLTQRIIGCAIEVHRHRLLSPFVLSTPSEPSGRSTGDYMNRKHFIRYAAAAALLGVGLGTGAMAQPWPAKPITMIIPFPPGGTLDVVGRLLAQKLGQQLGQTVIVDNRPGGAGTIGASAVSHAPGRGSTLLFSASTFTTTPMTQKTPAYDVV